MRCSTRPTVSTDRRQVRTGKLSQITSVVARSPWSWPVLPLVAIAAVGQWRGATAAEAVAVAFGAVGIGIAIGLALAGGRTRGRHASEPTPGANPSKTRSHGASPSGLSAEVDTRASRPNSARTVDLRGAKLTNTMLVRANLRYADLRQADLRGATLKGADLTGADLTDARLGPLDENPQSDEST